MPDTHLIYRQVLDVTFASKKEAMEGQNTLSRLYRRELMPQINELFDQLCALHQQIRIDKLEVDLGKISTLDFEHDFKQKLRNKLEDELIGEIQNRPYKPRLNNDGWETDTNKTLADSTALELFIFFIKTGQLPWWVTKEQFQSLDDLALELIENQPGLVLQNLLKLKDSHTCRERIIHQFPDNILAQFIDLKKTRAEIGASIKKLHQNLYQLYEHKQFVSLRKANVRLLLWEAAFDFCLFGETQAIEDSGTFTKTPMQAYFLYVVGTLVKNGITRERSKKHPPPPPQRQKLKPYKRLLQMLYEGTKQLGLENKLIGKMVAKVVAMPASTQKEMIANIEEAPRKKAEDSNEHEEVKRIKPDDSFEIHNAGLVIIAPFLPRFFDALGLFSESTFVTDTAAKRGVLITQYIITGETQMPEYELSLNKVICGVPLGEPLPGELDITRREKEEVQNLLKSILEHWQALGGTSVEGLRQTFFIKDAMLLSEPNGWTLRAERTGVDMLLDQLPWGISIIKLPWNDYMIHVEW